MVLPIMFQFTVDYHFTVMTYDSLVYYPLFVSWFRPLVLFNRTGIIYITTSVSQRLNILCIMLRLLIAPVASSNISCNDTVRPVICEEGGVLLACGTNLHYH